MVFGIGEALGLASAATGLLGAGKSKSMQQQPIYDPRANELLDLLSGRSKDLMNKPYQSPALLRYNPTSVFQQSPVLAAIQNAIDQSMTQAGAAGEVPPQAGGAPAMPAGAAEGRSLYAAMDADPYGMLGSNRKGGKLGYMSNAPINGSDADMAAYYKSWSNPTQANRDSYIANVLKGMQ